MKMELASSATRREIEEFLGSHRFERYQRIPLPHGLEIAGDDRTRAISMALRSGVARRSVLDVGTYYGLLPLQAVQQGARRVVALEPDSDRYEVARSVAAVYEGRWEVVHAPLEKFDTAEQFDVVTCMNVLHHVVDPLAFLRRLSGVTADDGELVVEFRTVGDRSHFQELLGATGRGARARAYIRSALLTAAAGSLPLMAVGDHEYDRVCYFSRGAFKNIVSTHLKLFDDVSFVASPSGGGRAIAYCRRRRDR
jgi:SAM-dependent methyltransferase